MNKLGFEEMLQYTFKGNINAQGTHYSFMFPFFPPE